MYATHLRLDITVGDGWRAVVRSAARKLTPPARRDARHRFYRQMLAHHHEAQHLVRTWRL